MGQHSFFSHENYTRGHLLNTVGKLRNKSGSLTIRICKEHLGLNDSVFIQFMHVISNILTLNFGNSMWTRHSLSSELLPRFAPSFQLVIMALIITIIVALPLGVLSAIRKNRWIDYIIRIVSINGVATPPFWLATLMMLAILKYSHAWFDDPWLPPIIYISPTGD